jgi:hypothetical protein
MGQAMTAAAKPFDIEPKLRRVASVVMAVWFALATAFRAYTRSNENPGSDSFAHCEMCIMALWISFFPEASFLPLWLRIRCVIDTVAIRMRNTYGGRLANPLRAMR